MLSKRILFTLIYLSVALVSACEKPPPKVRGLP